MPIKRPRITVIGHSTVLIEVDGTRLLTDPVLRDRVGPLRRHGPSVDPALVADIDAVLISHLHWDHFDHRSLRLLPRGTRLIVPPGAGEHAVKRGLPEVEELPVGAETRVGPVVVRATPADHSGFRPPLGPRADALGFLVGGSSRIYFAGDTDLFPEMDGLEEHLDVALLPVWGWGPRLGPGHLDPVRAVEALARLRPAATIPIHWGTFWPVGMAGVASDRRVDPPLEFAKLAGRSLPGVAIALPDPGEPVSFTT